MKGKTRFFRFNCSNSNLQSRDAFCILLTKTRIKGKKKKKKKKRSPSILHKPAAPEQMQHDWCNCWCSDVCFRLHSLLLDLAIPSFNDLLRIFCYERLIFSLAEFSFSPEKFKRHAEFEKKIQVHCYLSAFNCYVTISNTNPANFVIFSITIIKGV